jgi:hypothetical protein
MTDRELAAMTFCMSGLFIWFVSFKDARAFGCNGIQAAIGATVFLFAMIAISYGASGILAK